MGSQLRVMLWKNWLLKKRRPWTTFLEVMLPSTVMIMLMIVQTKVDNEFHATSAYVKEGMFVQVGQSVISPSFDSFLKLWLSKGEHLAFAPDNKETRSMIDNLSFHFPLLKIVAKLYSSELALETYIRSKDYGTFDFVRNLTQPKIRGAIVFYEQGPFLYDYSIRLNHSWAFSGFPDTKTIMDTSGAYLNDLEIGLNLVPTLQYGYSGFLTLQQVFDSYILLAGQLADSQERRTSSVLNGSALVKTFSRTHFGSNSHARKATSVKVDPAAKWEDLQSNKTFWMGFKPLDISIVPFPTRKYTDNEFQSIVKTVMGVLYLLAFLYPISRLISDSVIEKERKIKEGMHMMGLKDSVFHLSWFITYAIQFGISSMLITILTMNTIFEYSDKSLVFIYFYCFGISGIFLAFAITTFFSRAKTAVAVGTLSFLGAYFPYYTVVETSVPMPLKLLASLLSPTAFALGTVNFADYERAHVGVRWSNMWKESSGVNFLLCLVMMAVDGLLYAGAGWYLNKVLPRENGIRYPWNFLFTSNYWRNKIPLSQITVEREPLCDANEDLMKGIHGNLQSFETAFEPVPLDIRQQEFEGRCIQLQKLRKVYGNKDGDCVAVHSLELSLYENQILALLGHNGAGKSTTISMLVGLIPPTSGDAMVLGKSISKDMDKIRKQLGVCPQYNILFSELTVKEHLQLFGVLKGLDREVLNYEVETMISEVGLSEKADSLASTLSGGMKRKLSLAIALLGDSKVIILDEPTSGMDPNSMRATWQLLKRFRKGRVILLTTHSMDEADVLGDRIAIMGNGILRCCGSSLFLKHRYGVGYTLTIVKKSTESAAICDLVFHHVPSAAVLSDVGSEISFRLPLASTASFKELFNALDNCMQDASTCCDKNSGKTESNAYWKRNALGLESYGISVTTLEEVFLRVARGEYEMSKNASSSSSEQIGIMKCENTTKDAFIKSHEVGGVSNTDLRPGHVSSFTRFCNAFSCCLAMITGTVNKLLTVARTRDLCLGNTKGFLFWRHFKALLKKRAICARRDKRTIVFQLVVPPLFLFLGLLLLLMKLHPDLPSVTLTTAFYNPLLGGGGGGGPIPFNLSLPIAEKVATYVSGGWIQREEERSYRFPNEEQTLADAVSVAGSIRGPALISMSEFLITSLNESYQSRYGAVVWEEEKENGHQGYTVLHNSSCQHAGPTYINVMNNAILRWATGEANLTIRTRNYPLPKTPSQHKQRRDLNAFSAAIIVNIAFSFIPASFAVPIVKEREVKAKHQQLISGVSILAYWVSTYVWDFISYLLPASMALILFYIFGMNQFVGWDTIAPTSMVILTYGPAVAAATYCLTFLFSDYSVAQNVVLLIHFFSGLVLMLMSFIMNLIPATKQANSVLKNFFRISPGFCLADGLASLALRGQEMSFNSAGEPFDWNTTGASISYLVIEAVVYFMLVFLLEVTPNQYITFGGWKRWFTRNCHRKCYIWSSRAKREPFMSDSDQKCIIELQEEDDDVAVERRRVLSGVANNSMVCLANLQKVYSGDLNQTSKVAVQSLSFSVNEGECFGLLGVNGAGKTTTLSILSGEELPTEGKVYIMGNDVCTNQKAVRRLIGYCPQFDALLELLTAREHLELYARIKGVPEENLKEVVELKLTEFDLWPHANQPAATLSGGNKRKLSVAVAMVGEPPVIILDEPSSGMDPVAKRFLWDVITHVSRRRGKTAVILTTHSMAEAQALCTRIGIMVGGQLRCLGSPQHLKSRFGKSIELEVKAVNSTSKEIDDLFKALCDNFFNLHNHGEHDKFHNDPEMGSPLLLNASDMMLSQDMVIAAAHFLGADSRAHTLLASTSRNDGTLGDVVADQLNRDGGIQIKFFCEWWLDEDRFLQIDSFIRSSFLGASLLERNGSNFHYQLPYGKDTFLAQVFGHMEQYRVEVGIAEYSVGQSTLEAIFNSLASRH